MNWEKGLMLSIHEGSHPALDYFFGMLTILGGRGFLAAYASGMAIWLLTERKRKEAGIFAMASILTAILLNLIKIQVSRTRPVLWLSLIEPPGMSFPSGHSMISIMIYGLSAFYFAQKWQRGRIGIYTGFGLLILLIGLSRLYLGVHWPTDVLTGWMLGGLILTCSMLANKIWKKESTNT